MPNLNVGLFSAILLLVLPGITFANGVNVFDDDGNMMYSDPTSNYASISTTGTDPNCAIMNQEKVIFDCEGKCKWSKSVYKDYKWITVRSNGSHLEVQENGQRPVYVCSADGVWRKCARNNSDTQPFVDSAIQFRVRCNGKGYRQFLAEQLVNTNYVAEFCGDPYNGLNSSTYMHSLPHYCEVKGTNKVTYKYTSCMSGYRYVSASYPDSGKKCESCGSVLNGTYNATDNHIVSACNLTCDNGYLANNGQCSASGGSNGNCVNGKFDMEMYGGSDTDCRNCPSGAKCDGNEIYCPVGSYVLTNYDGETVPECRKCPDGGMVDTYYTDSFESCDNSGDDLWGRGESTNCLWTTYTNNDDTLCRAYRGTDNSGTYEFRNPSSNAWEYCEYRN